MVMTVIAMIFSPERKVSSDDICADLASHPIFWYKIHNSHFPYIAFNLFVYASTIRKSRTCSQRNSILHGLLIQPIIIK